MSTNGDNVIVLAVDGSESSEYAAHFYTNYIYKPGTKVHLVCAIEISGHTAGNANPTKLEEIIAEKNAHAMAIIEKFKAIMQPFGAECSYSTPSGAEPWRLICSEAEKQKAIMIVMGSRGLGKILRTIMGSVSDSVIHNSTVPVLICKMP